MHGMHIVNARAWLGKRVRITILFCMTTIERDRGSGYFRSKGTRIFYRLFGDAGKTPVVIVHGLSYFSYDWIEPARGLAADRQVAVIDMRGFGESDWATDYSIPANASDIVELIEHFGWPKAALIGHSMGGRHCTYCAAKNPGRVAALVLVDWSPELAPAGSQRVTETVGRTPDKFVTVAEAMQYFGIAPNSPAAAAKRARFDAYLKPVPGGFAIKRDTHFRDQFKRILETGERPKGGVDMWAALREVACPTLALRGKLSDMFSAATVPKMVQSNPRISLVELEAGHDIAGGDRDGFLREVCAFFAEHGV